MNAEPAAPPRKSRVPLVAGVVVVLFMVLVTLKVISGGKPHITPDVRGDSDAAIMFNEAKTLVRQGKWAEAKAKLEAVREEDSDYEPRQIENYLKVATQELPNEARFATAAAAIAKGELGRAAAALAQVKTNTQEKALTDAKAALAARIEERRTEARTLLSSSKWDSLLALSEDLLVALPGDREASEWKQQADQAIARGKRGPVKVVSTETPWVEAQQRFKSGDVTGALSLAESCGKKYPQCRTLEDGLRLLEAKSKNLESVNDNELVKLFELDIKCAGGGGWSELSKPLRTRLSSRFSIKASNAKSTGNWAKAVEYARQALEAMPGEAAAQAIVTEGRQISGDLYVRAYQLRDTDPSEAVKLFKEVIAMTPSDDQNHVKAKGFVERLEAR
jgi:hypothetical protein